MSFCLDDGSELLFGPASGSRSEPGAIATGFPADEPQTAILHSTAVPGESPTRAQIQSTDQTAVLRTGPEAEPQKSLGDATERQSPSAHRAAKPLIVAVVAVLILVGGYLGYRYFSPVKQIDSIAVMPFVNESGNADVEYLSDGMTETLMSSLAQVPGLRVKARSSVSRYLDKDAQTVGRELGVQAVLSGRIVKSGEDMSVFLELVDARTGDRLWGERYVRPMAGLVALQSDIARDVSQKLSTRLTGAEQQRITKNYTENAEAYRLYLQGRFFWNKRTADGFRAAIPLFEKAVALDPNYALAYTGLADCYSLMGIYEFAKPKEVMPRAKEYVMRALSLDPDLAEAHASLGHILNAYDYDFIAAEREYRRAIELNPSYVTAHQWLGQVLAQTGRFDESIGAMDRALELDPFSLIVNRMKGFALLFAKRYDEARWQMDTTTTLDPNFPGVYYDLFLINHVMGRHAESVEAFARWRELSGDVTGAARARNSFAKSGWSGFFKDMIERNRTEGVFAHYHMVTAHIALGEKEEAIRELKLSFDERENDIYWLKFDSRIDPLRDDPRFQEIIAKVGFPEYQEIYETMP